MTKDEALRLALEALKETWYHVGTFSPTDEAIELYDKAIRAIKAALETKDEPFEYWNAVGWFGYDTGLRLWFETDKNDDGAIPLYKDQQQRTWVWLTDKEVDECLQGLPTQTIDVYARRIEIKIKDKNT